MLVCVSVLDLWKIGDLSRVPGGSLDRLQPAHNPDKDRKWMDAWIMSVIIFVILYFCVYSICVTFISLLRKISLNVY